MIDKLALAFGVTVALTAVSWAVGRQDNGATGRRGDECQGRFSKVLKISAFKDITAFILDQMSSRDLMPLELTSLDVNYVKDASQAHADFIEQRVDLVFMSYDDTLTMALQENHPDIVAVMPVHGGILDLCGEIDIAAGIVNIGIDTDSGYARALRAYLCSSYSAEGYKRFQFVFAGATNLRYEKLLQLNSAIHATLLNPPYSFGEGVNRLHRLTNAFGAYQGVVANANRSWLADKGNAKRLRRFADVFYETVRGIRNSPTQSIKALQAFYRIPEGQATATFERLWASDGLSLNGQFNSQALAVTRKIFIEDSGVVTPNTDDFIEQLATE